MIRSIPDSELALGELRRVRDVHPLWQCRLLEACRDGTLEYEDLQYVFSQYRLYSGTFTRFISALMTSCESDLFRASLSENLWEEGGGCTPERRHAELFRRFLQDGLELPLAEPQYDPHTTNFVREYLAYCRQAEPLAASAFLSLGTEGIVAPLYKLFVAALRRAGVPDDQLSFFHMHIDCDDAHAATLEQLMLSYRDEPGWFESCRRAMTHALDLRLRFFDDLVDALPRRRMADLLRGINDRHSLCAADASALRHRRDDVAPPLYSSRIDAEGIELTVTRVPLAAEVLDPRQVVIPPDKRNERHRHAHETFMYFIAGSGHVDIDDHRVEVAAGDSVLVPRWAMHQTHNTGTVPLCFIAVTDYHLTRRAFVGDAKAYRRDEAANHHRHEQRRHGT